MPSVTGHDPFYVLFNVLRQPCPNCGVKLRYVLVSAIGYGLHIYDGREYILKELDSNHMVFMCPKCDAELPISHELVHI